MFNFSKAQSPLYANHANVISLKTSAPRLNHNTLIQYQRKKKESFDNVCLLDMKICFQPDARGRGGSKHLEGKALIRAAILFILYFFALPLFCIL